MQKTGPKFLHCFFLIPILILGLQAAAVADIEQVPQELSPAFEHLISYASPPSPGHLDADLVNQVIQFVNQDKNLKNTFSMGERKGAASNYSEFTLSRTLKEVLDLVYNPAIPPHITTPASIRRSKWIQIDGRTQALPKLSDYLAKLDPPVIVNGVEYVENTPDTFSGAYYAYELDRALILTRQKGHNILISISRQRNKSEVGKKGVVLGSDDNWDYLYTGEKGCTKAGLGWVDSYMYNSASITVYYEVTDPTPQVRCGVFKWIRAGWAGINLVQPHHIRDGVDRFARNFKSIIESPVLADTVRLSKAFEQIDRLSNDELRQKVRRYYLHLKEIYHEKSRLALRWFEQLPGKDGYLAKMTPEEMKAILDTAYLKHLLGMNPGIDVSFIRPVKKASRYPG